MKQLKWKFILVLVTIVIGLITISPTIIYYSKSTAEREKLERKRAPILKRIINFGLDLRGGMHLILELDETKVKPEDLPDAVDRAIEIIRNRIDQFGVAEPLIVKQGEKWIVVQLPGVKEPQRAKELLGKTALLEFKLVDETGAAEKILTKLQDLNITQEELLQSTTFPKEILELVPTGYTLLPAKGRGFYVLKSSPEITGGYLKNARIQLGGDFGLPIVGLEFDKDGAKIFSKVTEANINKNLAIVLDGVVQSAPVIRTRIPDGRAIIEGNFTPEEAKDLAITLRAGVLPAPVKIIEERIVGPTLGEDSIKSGILAAIVGSVIVIIFMIFYYKLSGIIANLALVVNIFFIIAAMSYFKATLTLPGIAGIVLTIGMAVDANVLIFERIKEELRAGKTVRIAIDQGFQKALSAILDSNLTTLITSAFLFQFGTGPIKGFAVTLSLGLIFNLFTAVFVSKLIFDFYLTTRKISVLNI